MCGVSKTLCVCLTKPSPFPVVTTADQEPAGPFPAQRLGAGLFEDPLWRNFLCESHHKSPAQPAFFLKIFVVVSVLCVVYKSNLDSTLKIGKIQ